MKQATYRSPPRSWKTSHFTFTALFLSSNYPLKAPQNNPSKELPTSDAIHYKFHMWKLHSRHMFRWCCMPSSWPHYVPYSQVYVDIFQASMRLQRSVSQLKCSFSVISLCTSQHLPASDPDTTQDTGSSTDSKTLLSSGHSENYKSSSSTKHATTPVPCAFLLTMLCNTMCYLTLWCFNSINPSPGCYLNSSQPWKIGFDVQRKQSFWICWRKNWIALYLAVTNLISTLAHYERGK